MAESSFTSSNSVRFVLVLSCWYLFTLCSNMAGKAFVKTTLDAVSPTTVSLGCATGVYVIRELLYGSHDDVWSRGELHRWAAVVGFIQFLATAMTYASFALSSVSWTYCFRTLEPLMSAALQFVVFHETLSVKELSALSILASGIVVTVTASSGSQVYSAWIGGLAATATAIYSTRSVVGSRVMRQFQVSGRDLFLLASSYGFFFSLWTQISVTVLQGTQFGGFSARLIAQLFFTGLFHCVYNLLSFDILQQLMPVAHGVCNTMKRVFMVVVSAMLSGQWLAPLQLLGILTANAAAAVYSIEVKKRRQQKKQSLASISSGDRDDSEYNNATDSVMTDLTRNNNQAELNRLGIWIVFALLLGVLYFGFSLTALASWKASLESDHTNWNPEQFFANLFSKRNPSVP